METETQLAEAVARLQPYLRPGFAELWRELGSKVGYRKLGRELRWAIVPDGNGQRETVIVEAAEGRDGSGA